MINDLEQFSVERLERLIRNASGVVSQTHFELSPDDIAALARIALAAKSAGLVPVPDEFLEAQQNDKGLFELSEDCMTRLAVALSQQSKSLVINPGYKLVPIEPSLKMMEAAVTCEDASFDTESGMVSIHHEVIYKAMLAASPALEGE